jgi:hypothetical protein
MEILGTIKVIGAEEVVGAAGTFKKRLVVVQTEEQYPQSIPVDFVQDKCSILDKFAIGDKVKVSVNVRGNEYNGKFYVSFNGWKIEKTSVETATPKVETKADDLHF